MNKKDLRQYALDVDRLHLIADRLGLLEDAHRDALARLELATQSLKVIATWATVRNDRLFEETLEHIENRAMDTLKIIGEIK